MTWISKTAQVQVVTSVLVLNVILEVVLGVVAAASSQVDTSLNRRSVKVVEHSLYNLHGRPGEGYHLQVEIGTPKQKLNVLIDTGSSNLAVACAPHEDVATYFQRDKSSTYEDRGIAVNVPYTIGSWSGELGRDYMAVTSLDNSSVMSNIACITEQQGFYINGSYWQGILGLGYADLARPDSSIQPWFTSLVQVGKVNNYFSVALCGMGLKGTDPNLPMGGAILFGQTDSSLYTGSIYPTPINKEWYYEVVITDVQVNGESLGMDCKEYNMRKTIVDTGTTNLRLPTRVFNKVKAKMIEYIQTVPNANIPKPGFWTGDDILCWPAGLVRYDEFPTIGITLPVNSTSAFTLVVAPQQYLRPVGEENESSGEDCFKMGVSSIETDSVIGAVALEGYYVIFDREKKQVKFAESTCGTVDSSFITSTIVSNVSLTGGYSDCVYQKPSDNKSVGLAIVGYVMAGVCGVCIIPLLVLVVHWQCRRCFGKPQRQRMGSDCSDLVDSS